MPRCALDGHTTAATRPGLCSGRPSVRRDTSRWNVRSVDAAVDGFAVTLWTYYEVVAADLDLPGAYADVLQRLHTGMRSVEIATPHS